jgi:DNA-binding transcriptional MocR family regulator
MPTYQNPTGIVMSMERRYKLLDLAYRYQIPIIEDDPYGELRYDGDFLPPLKALDKHGYVIYLGTFSKSLFMGFRVGWAVASSQVISKFALMKQFTDLQANTPSQWVLDNFLRKGFYKSHLNKVQKEYRIKRDIMNESLQKYNTCNIQWYKPNGGFYIWCRLPDKIRQSVLISKATKKGIAYVPGEAFCADGVSHRNYIRLNYTYPAPEQIVEGIKGLTEAVHESISEIARPTEEVEHNKRPLV